VGILHLVSHEPPSWDLIHQQDTTQPSPTLLEHTDTVAMSLFAPTNTEPPSKGDCLHMKDRNVTISQGARIVQSLDELLDELVPVAGPPGRPFVDALKRGRNFWVSSIPSETPVSGQSFRRPG
jgi:hypothetical protein